MCYVENVASFEQIHLRYNVEGCSFEYYINKLEYAAENKC